MRHLCCIADPAGDDPVDQRGAERAVLVDIFPEVVAKSPLVNILVDALQELFAVVVDQLAGEDHEASLARLESLVKDLSELAGEGVRGLVLELAGGIIDDSCFRRIGYDVLQIVGACELHHRLVAFLFIGVQASGDGRDDALPVDLLAVLAASKVQCVKAFLLVDHLSQAGLDRLYQDALAVPVSLLVRYVEPVVYERAEEISLAELHDLLRCVLQNVSVIA